MLDNEIFKAYSGRIADIETDDDYFDDVTIENVFGDWLVIKDEDNTEHLINLMHVVDVELHSEKSDGIYGKEDKKRKKRFGK